ncbi:uncharacterized protein [Typha latifolia]|uniref:uncharacterized protein n=1 Tax=Typha latifolia TaxID=4733 RepID=UPI003C2C9085
MRFFEFVPCGWRSARPKAAPAPAPETARVMEEAELVSSVEGESPEKRRRRSSHSVEKPWKPSLVAISEADALVVTAKAKAKAAAGNGRGSRGGGSGKDKVRVIPRRDREDFRHFGVPTMIPAFAPTPFLF